MFNKHFYGIIISIDDIKIDKQDRAYREIVFQEVNQNIFFDGRKIYARVYDYLDICIWDMIFCQNFRVFYRDTTNQIRGENINQIRLERNWIDSCEHVGNQECQIQCDPVMFRRMKAQQEFKKNQYIRLGQGRQVQSRIEKYFRK